VRGPVPNYIGTSSSTLQIEPKSCRAAILEHAGERSAAAVIAGPAMQGGPGRHWVSSSLGQQRPSKPTTPVST